MQKTGLGFGTSLDRGLFTETVYRDQTVKKIRGNMVQAVDFTRADLKFTGTSL